MKRCPKCKGVGYIYHPSIPYVQPEWRNKCDRCAGNGRVER
jgi:DnaJ-class molecular chaperone